MGRNLYHHDIKKLLPREQQKRSRLTLSQLRLELGWDGCRALGPGSEFGDGRKLMGDIPQAQSEND